MDASGLEEPIAADNLFNPVGDLEESILGFERRSELPASLAKLGYRSQYLWEVSDYTNRITTLSSVPDKFREHLIYAKNLTVLLTVIIDDVADSTRDREVFRDLVRILQRPDVDSLELVPKHPETVLAAAAWNEVIAILKGAPRYREFLDLWLFDVAELVQCQRYNLIINENPALANTEEYLVYSTHNFNVKIHMTMDLMFSPDFRREELGTFRRALQHIQVAVELINDRYTLEREIGEEGSVASYPIIWCLESGRTDQIESGHVREEEPLLGRSLKAAEEIQSHHLREAALALGDVSSFDVKSFLRSLEVIEEDYRTAAGRL